ncbi:hypothetical protein K493DRAFT_48036 [Basidiobolus meristosporus CBS 931.73]|uniref:Uncharacterized protein n=1 Tax=Basidiobolus meristosporus CBS 931.73 TaxID=1314790 RepID=A0A1Y1Y1J3_9FUNG|nr:hypothetical protein K493DRAFT_48036 [Basidiobolus meristosporus CBS 931.73]|eukprot:ORX91819.1 hypothetical protein K493DRAFT_48036 [Basidiobolus meristosporus CBS 931.73]
MSIIRSGNIQEYLIIFWPSLDTRSPLWQVKWMRELPAARTYSAGSEQRAQKPVDNLEPRRIWRQRCDTIILPNRWTWLLIFLAVAWEDRGNLILGSGITG